MAKRKKQEIDLGRINPDDLLKETVACSILGRTIASLGGKLTGREKSDRSVLYSLLKAGKKPDESLPVTARQDVIKKDEERVYSDSEAIKLFSEQYPKEALPLLKLLEERKPLTSPALVYGLKEGERMDDNYMIDILQSVLGLKRTRARFIYERVVKPEIEKSEEEKGLVSIAMKD